MDGAEGEGTESAKKEQRMHIEQLEKIRYVDSPVDLKNIRPMIQRWLDKAGAKHNLAQRFHKKIHTETIEPRVT